ncbi:MAG: 1-acyl-sn-glycerol-3-phosphate acyltransferase [Bacteriovoracaceae bacterium]|nr:1-acyl-sn-glycerol-3-phosphate acyltransferase [Bacteriovoracaceae bacterium]
MIKRNKGVMEVYDAVLSYEKVKTHLQEKPQDKEKILKFVDEIKGDYRFGLVGAGAKFIDKTFLRLYNGFNLELPDGFDIKELQKKYHLILVPNHQSHADYLALQYILYTYFKMPVYIAAGINLNIFPIGSFFKRCGAFFIRRKFTNYLYKIAFQGYIYYLLKSDKVVEFFFEGGRTRSGKLLAPRYGLFSMLLDAHTKFGDNAKPLMFIPVSLAHEMIPEEKAHAKELSGAKKEKEKITQLVKLVKLANKKLGTVHVRFGEGIVVDKFEEDLKEKTQSLAFDCFRAVGKGMPVTPTSLLSLVMLDDPQGALTWSQIKERSLDVVDYCEYMGIPTTKSLRKDVLSKSLKIAMDMFINNKKVKLIKREKLNQVFYSITESSRTHLLFHKNMILHHFIVPGIVNATWFNIFNGNIKTESQLNRYLVIKRKELKYEFYLPTVREMIREAAKIVEYATGEKINSLNDALHFSPEKLYAIASKVRRFSTAFSYIYEAYYIAATTIKYMDTEEFTEEKFLQVAKELFEMEREHGRVVKYPESFNVPIMKGSLNYLQNLGVLERKPPKYEVKDMETVNILVEKFARDVNDQVAINLKFGR